MRKTRICPYFIICCNQYCELSKPGETSIEAVICPGKNHPEFPYIPYALPNVYYSANLDKDDSEGYIDLVVLEEE